MKGNFRSIVAERRARRMRTDLSDIAGICKEAWKRTMQMERGADGKDSNPAMHGFEKTGIYPFDPSKISPDLKKIGDGLLERARLLREQEEAKEDGLHVPKVTGKRERDEDDGGSDASSDDEDEELQGEERAAAIAAVLVEPVPIQARLLKVNKGKVRKAELLTGDQAIARLLDAEEAKQAAEKAKAERKRARAAKAAAKAAAAVAPKQAKKKARALLSHLLSPPASSSSSSSAAAAASSPAALITPSLPAGGGSAAPAAVAFGGDSAFATAMAGAGAVL